MNKNFISIKTKLATLPEGIREDILALITKVEKDLTIAEFKLGRTEKMKKTISNFLDESVEELELKNSELNNTLKKLQAAQAQLIQTEKMASLGELTAGIAHEIQNPLNFVNNFSEVNLELVDEIKEELNEGNYEDVKEILDDLKDNTEKVSHHGKRADGIVKSMLQHSRISGGEKMDTDINILCDEYLRLAYHGMRAKDKIFNAEMETHFDESLPKLSIIRQDIGRVLLNLMTNAFQAMKEKSQTEDDSYKPKISIKSAKSASKNSILITVSDNGSGIPKEIADKIFQPFFTTKPTGSGTGLGLSISYDIIKAHGGNLEMASEDGNGTEFIISLI